MKTKPYVYQAKTNEGLTAWLTPIVFEGEKHCLAEFSRHTETGLKLANTTFADASGYGATSREIEPDDLEGGYELIRRAQ